MDKELTNILITGARELSIELAPRQVEAFGVYLEELKKWNKKINLTSIRSDRDIVIRHFLDSLIPVRFIKGKSTLLDIGSGAGFPGIPIKIALPHLNVTLLEGVEKKVHFLRHIVRMLGLKDISPLWARAEDASVISGGEPSAKGGRSMGREGFDCVISRALARIDDFLKLAMPYRKKGGSIIAMKGPFEKKLKHELKGYSLSLYPGAGVTPASGAGGPSAELHEITIPFTKQKTSIVIFA